MSDRKRFYVYRQATGKVFFSSISDAKCYIRTNHEKLFERYPTISIMNGCRKYGEYRYINGNVIQIDKGYRA